MRTTDGLRAFAKETKGYGKQWHPHVQRHTIKEVERHTMIKQWKVTCSCGHESFDQTRKEAIGWHRDHAAESKKSVEANGEA